jgi:RimJ/RimL family protein N-acetyltransferase
MSSSVELRDFELVDGQLLMAWIGGPADLLTWAGSSFSYPLDEQQLAAYAARAQGPDLRSWMGRDPGTGECVGHVSLRIDAARASGRLGRVLVAPAARGRGYGAAMVERVLATAFGELGMERVELGVFVHNVSAVRLYERLGFVDDGEPRVVEQLDGRPWSAQQMVLPESAWRIRTRNVRNAS